MVTLCMAVHVHSPERCSTGYHPVYSDAWDVVGLRAASTMAGRSTVGGGVCAPLSPATHDSRPRRPNVRSQRVGSVVAEPHGQVPAVLRRCAARQLGDFTNVVPCDCRQLAGLGLLRFSGLVAVSTLPVQQWTSTRRHEKVRALLTCRRWFTPLPSASGPNPCRHGCTSDLRKHTRVSVCAACCACDRHFCSFPRRQHQCCVVDTWQAFGVDGDERVVRHARIDGTVSRQWGGQLDRTGHGRHHTVAA